MRPRRAVVPEIWVIDDDERARRAIARMVAVAGPAFTVCIFSGIDEANEALKERVPAGVIVDERLGEDRGHAWALARRDILDRTYVALCTAFLEPAISEYLDDYVDTLLIKPVTPDAIRKFVEHAAAGRRPTRPGASSWVRRMSLSSAQARVAELLWRGVPPEAIARRLRISANTTRKHIYAVMREADVHSLSALLSRFLAAQSGGR